MSGNADPVGSELLFANDRVRVWAMRLEPGETCAPHRHRNDYLMLYPEPAIGRSTSRSRVERAEAGLVAFATVGTLGLPTHQVTNLGPDPSTHYIIELLGPSATATAQPPTHNGRIHVEPHLPHRTTQAEAVQHNHCVSPRQTLQEGTS
jgi:hypothetical protein